MSPVSSSCPGCGAPIVFGIDTSLVTVCKSCSSIVGRGDRALESLGKVSGLTETGAQLNVGRAGKFEGKRFTLTGRTQLAHEAGGVWDEWYAAFDDGRWGWLAEAQGHYYLTFETPVPGELPAFSVLSLADALTNVPAARALVISEKGVATAVSAEGELPFELTPNAKFTYADLSGQGAGFATIDYSDEPPRFFFGKQVTLDEINIKIDRRVEPKRTTTATQVSCPHCGAPLQLRAPDAAKRVVCPSCDSLLDAQEGALRFLETLKQPKAAPKLPLGKKVTIFGGDFETVGYVVRSVTYEGTRYPWEEYLLHSTAVGFRWLVCADGHWSFGEPVNVADVTLAGAGRTARFNGGAFRLFQSAEPRVDAVYGEFFWAVKVGETVQSQDFIAPPLMLTCEEMKYESGGGEVSWTRLTYVDKAVLEKAFGVTLAKPEGVAPNQVFPHKSVYKAWRRSLAAAFVLFLVLAIAAKETVVFERSIGLEALSTNEGTQVFFSEPFALQKGNIEVAVQAPDLQNSWIFVQGDFIEEDTGLVQEFSVPVEYYAGVDDGESWSEGGRSATTLLSRLPPGRYSMRLECQWGQWQAPTTFHVRVRQDVLSGGYFFLVLFLLSIIPVLVAIRNYAFDVRRWRDSDYSPYSSG